MSKLDVFFGMALAIHSLNNSSHLGDRTQYIGASDIASCPRKAVLSKIHPIPHDTSTLMRFARGHITEDLLARIFEAGGATFLRQVEVCHPCEPIRCHIDFLFYSSRNGRIHLVELKSVDGIPHEPYSSWIDQLHVQLGLFRENNPDSHIGGSILAVDLNAGAWQEFNGLSPNETVYRFLLEKKGKHILSALRGDCEPDTEPGILCGYCSYRSECPGHGGAQPIPREILTSADAYERLSRQKDTIEAGLEVLRNDILAFTGTARSFRGQEGDLSIVTTVCPGATMVDSKKLKADYPDIYKECSKPKRGSTKLEVKRIRPSIGVEGEQAAA